jgi:hypothetical protein
MATKLSLLLGTYETDNPVYGRTNNPGAGTVC